MKPTIVIITGLAGSGKTVALRALEDGGFYCVDNLPVTLMAPFVSAISSNKYRQKVVVGVDIREREFLPALDPILHHLRNACHLEVIFLEAEKDVLIRRFKETRRPHPLAAKDVGLEKALEMEAAMLLPLRKEATRIIDTSSFTPHQLRQLFVSLCRAPSEQAAMSLTLISFGFKFGMPQNVDMLFDVRFLPNPYFVPELREMKGTDRAVRDFVLTNSVTGEFIEKTAGLLNFLIPRFIAEGKAYLTVGFGCTGGRHRSPAIVETMAGLLRDNHVEITVVHRDLQ
ncbi:MAG TPA: RNase adapter RapZ [Thermodesulfovibrionales bacterium]|nr:RNase adapter RapZ [Thermodesulfovibrionales bacterium]